MPLQHLGEMVSVQGFDSDTWVHAQPQENQVLARGSWPSPLPASLRLHDVYHMLWAAQLCACFKLWLPCTLCGSQITLTATMCGRCCSRQQ